MPNFLQCVVLDTVTNQFLMIPSWDPPQKTRDANYDDVMVRGRSEPHVFYSNTGLQVWQITLHLTSNLNMGDTLTPLSVKVQENFLESLTMPDYGAVPGAHAGVVNPPHPVRISILRMFDAIGTIRNLSFTYVEPFDMFTGFPHQIDATFSFHGRPVISSDEKPHGFADIRKSLPWGQDFQS